MKYSPGPTLLGSILLFISQFAFKDSVINSNLYFIGIVILTTISITISTGKEIKK